MTVTVLLFILGLVLLIKGGDWFVDGATGIAHNISTYIIGFFSPDCKGRGGLRPGIDSKGGI